MGKSTINGNFPLLFVCSPEGICFTPMIFLWGSYHSQPCHQGQQGRGVLEPKLTRMLRARGLGIPKLPAFGDGYGETPDAGWRTGGTTPPNLLLKCFKSGVDICWWSQLLPQNMMSSMGDRYPEWQTEQAKTHKAINEAVFFKCFLWVGVGCHPWDITHVHMAD